MRKIALFVIHLSVVAISECACTQKPSIEPSNTVLAENATARSSVPTPQASIATETKKVSAEDLAKATDILWQI